MWKQQQKKSPFMCSPTKCIPPKNYLKCYVESYILDENVVEYFICYHVLPKYNIQKHLISLSEIVFAVLTL